MTFGYAGMLGTGLVILAAACSDSAGGDVTFTGSERATIGALSPLAAVESDPTNKYAANAAAAAFGQKLFFDTRFSGTILAAGALSSGNGGLGQIGDTGKISCASCHQPDATFQDVRSVPNSCTVAAGWTLRNTPPLVNAAFYKWFFWDGRADALWVQALLPVEANGEMNSSRLHVAHALYANYKAEYNALFDPDLDPGLDPASATAKQFPDSLKPPSDPQSPWNTMKPADQDVVNRIFANFGKALAAYETLLVARNSPFDRYVAGDEAAMNTQAKLGLRLFIGKAACVVCHAGPLLSDNKFHNTGVVQHQGDLTHVPTSDQGRFAGIPQLTANALNGSGAYSDSPKDGKASGLVATDADRGAFRTKGLREVAMTGPYMHGGQIATLEDVIDHYDRGGGAAGAFEGTKDPLMVPLNLTASEKTQLVEFLHALTGEAVPAALTRGP